MPLQKSFSEQNHSSKQRSQWHRNRSFQGPQSASSKAQPKRLQEKPSIPVSTATKNKLSTFEFGGQSDSETMAKPVFNLLPECDKENVALLDGEPFYEMQDGAKKVSEDRSKISGTAEMSIPSTPAPKLALPDLIGMGDIRRAVQNISPEDRIGWDHDKDSSSSSFGGITRTTKRARSSSPQSSPAQVSNYVYGKGELSNQQFDPGSELWGRYALHGSAKPTPPGAAMPTLARIMHMSSPQPSKDGNTPRSVAGLRRANSCGIQFPKRRRVQGYEDNDIFTEFGNVGPSKLSVLIERVQEGFTKPRKPHLAENAGSSSPKSLGERTVINDEASPLHTQGDDERVGPKRPVSGEPHSRPSEVDYIAPQRVPTQNSNSSDYGDFDDSELHETLITLEPPQEIRISNIPKIPLSKLAPNLLAIDAEPPSMKDSKAIKSSTLDGEEDEFADSDEDMMEDLENIAARYDEPRPVEIKLLPVSKEIASIPKLQKGRAIAEADSDDDYGDDNFDDLDFAFAEAAATQSIEQTAGIPLPSTRKVRAIQRYFVANIVDFEYVGASGRKEPEKILLLQIEHTKTVKMVHLRGSWLDTPVTKKAFVHVIGAFEANGRCIIDDVNNMLILHPDHLISSTVVADSFGCTRRAVLQDRVKATSESSSPLIYGTVLHEIFQAALIANRWDTEWLGELIQSVVSQHIEDLYTIRLSVPQAVEYLQSKMGELQAWAELFVTSQPKPEAIVKAGNGQTNTMCVTKLLDVEEHVWSPMYGLKGNIDATVQVTMQDGKQERTLTVPFEVKTGKNASAAHRAQTALYNLLLSDRYDVEIAFGILYYMETSETIRIPAIRHEVRHMIMQRNELACFVRERHAQLPPMLKKENMCNRCYAKVPCFVYHKLADDGTGETSGMKAKFDAVVKHLTPKHKEFFLKWDDLLTKEEKESLKFRRELWTMLSSERERLGRCFSNVIIEPGSAYEEPNNPKINRYRYTLVKQTPPSGFSFLDSQIVVGEPIVISDENGHFALANGYVTKVRKQKITVAVDRRLHNTRTRRPGFDEINNQVFASIMNVAPDGSSNEQWNEDIVVDQVQYRLDKDEFSNGMATVRNNLIQVMVDGTFGSREIRNLVVDLHAPRFKTHSTAYTLTDRSHINVDQRRAIQKVMSAEDYALVLGMPGTGKTTTIAHIIRALVSQGKSVLLTSYTHTAVDNILLKIRDDNIPILRLGTIAKINAEVQEFATLAATRKTSFEEIRSAWHDTPIVATTCLGISHPIFNERTFDYCIVDEASQITLPVCLGPIRLARTFILVGDHNQLPPLVQNEEARTGGLDISLFKHLSDVHPSSVVYLEHQYRMCEDVMALSNHLIYKGRLKCGSKEVAERRTSIPNMDALRNHHFTTSNISLSQKTICPGPILGRCWIRDLLDPQNRVVFLNTDPLVPVSREEAKGNRIVNPTEAKICVQLVESLLSVGVAATSIGVMTHYRSQLSLLKYGLRRHTNVEMHTADRFQGRDKDVIILSLVRNNEARSIGELLKDWRRINVAFTRAKTKLLVIGSKETLKGSGSEEMVAKFVGLMEERGWIYDLPKGALDCHLFSDGATQVTASGASRPGGTQGMQRKEEDGCKNKTVIEKGQNGKKQPRVIRGGEGVFNLGARPVLQDIVNDLNGF